MIAETVPHANMEELFEAVFSVRSVSRLYKEILMGPEEPCAGEGQQKFNRPTRRAKLVQRWGTGYTADE
jgi:hypothetical protein